MPLYDVAPEVSKDAWVAPSASVIGDVSLGSKSSVWYGSILRGESAGLDAVSISAKLRTTVLFPS